MSAMQVIISNVNRELTVFKSPKDHVMVDVVLVSSTFSPSLAFFSPPTSKHKQHDGGFRTPAARPERPLR